MEKKLILLCVIICTATAVWADNRKGLLEAIFGSAAVQMSDNTNYEVTNDGKNEKLSEKAQIEKIFAGMPPFHHDTIHVPIPTLQTVVIHRPKPEPIHIHKPPKEHIYIHEEKPHEDYYVIKPQHHEHHKPIHISYGNNHKDKPNGEPVYIAFHKPNVKPSHESQNHKPTYEDPKPIYIPYKPEQSHNHNKPQPEYIVINKPEHSNNKPTSEHYVYKPIYENNKPSFHLENKPHSDVKPDRNIIIQILAEKPEQLYGNKPEFIQVNPGQSDMDQFFKPPEFNNHFGSPIYITNGKPNFETQFIGKPSNFYPVTIQEMLTEQNGIKEQNKPDNDKQTDSDLPENLGGEITKKPINFWDLITKPFQSSTIHQEHEQAEDESCNDESVTKPLRCIFRNSNVKKLNSTDYSRTDLEELVRNNTPVDESEKVNIAPNLQPSVPSMFPQFWLAKPTTQLQKHPTQNQKITDDAIVDSEDDETEEESQAVDRDENK